MNLKVFVVLPLSLLMFACASGPQKSETTASDSQESASSQPIEESESKTVVEQDVASESADGAFHILYDIPYSENAIVDERVRKECTNFGTQLSDFVVKYAPKYKIDVEQTGGPLPLEGRSVDLQIGKVSSWGNAFIGHKKSVELIIGLQVDGEISNLTTKTRESGGGMWGGFKSSCDVFNRVAKALGKDVAQWLGSQQ